MMRASNQLVEAARSGDSIAILELLEVCQPDLKRFARRTCTTTEDAEDAVQIALWQLYRRIGALRATAMLASWLFRIVERECIRLFRGQTKGDALDELNDQTMPAAPEVPADLRVDLGRAIQRLPRPYRDVLIMRDVHELTGPEVAAQLGISLAAVKSRLNRARAAVRDDLMASGYWSGDES